MLQPARPPPLGPQSVLRLSPDELSFDDVAGVDVAKSEVREVVSMLRDPARYALAGARLPAGVLMVGPPGTGKTLLARVMAAQVQHERRAAWLRVWSSLLPAAPTTHALCLVRLHGCSSHPPVKQPLHQP